MPQRESAEANEENHRYKKILKVKNIHKVVEFLLLMSGQATIYDQSQRGDELSEFGKAFLR